MQRISVFLLFLLFVIALGWISCDNSTKHTPIYYDAWRVCDEEVDPIHDCAWLKNIIANNKFNRLIVAEVIAKQAVDGESVVPDELFYGYQVYYEHKGCVTGVSDGLYTDAYDCLGNIISGDGRMGIYFIYPDTTSNSIEFNTYEITEYNIIYEH